jgi:predicted Zn-dependent protease
MVYEKLYIRIAAAGNFDEKFLTEFQKELQNILWETLGINANCFYNVSNSGGLPIYKIPSTAYTSHIGKYNTHTLFLFGNERREESLKKFGKAAVLLKVLVLVDVDIYKQGFTGTLFGEADVDGNIAIITTAPLENHFKSSFLIKERALKEALHEIGHTLGLHHCKIPGCAMNISKDIYDIDEKKKTYCKECLNKLFGGYN